MPHPSFSWRALVFLLCGLVLRQGQAAVAINEIHYRPLNKLDQTEFVELVNSGATPLNVSGWKLEGAVSYALPSGTQIAPGGFLVIAQNPAAILSRFGVAALGPWSGMLSNEGEELRLINSGGGTEDSVEYKLGFPWPTVGDAPGYSIELINPDFDNDLGGNWRSSFNPSAQQGEKTVLIPRKSKWRYLKGLGEASNPTSAWRQRTFDDGSWLQGAMPIGYDPSIPMGVYLDDMKGQYISVFFRGQFAVTNVNLVRSLSLSALYDDGFKVWINGVAVNDGDFNMRAGEVTYSTASGTAREDSNYREFLLNNPRNYLVNGTNVIAIQAANANRDSSTDFYLDVELTAITGAPNYGPTPGGVNSVFATNAPPQVRQVAHTPKQPASGETVKITAKITDPQGVSEVRLQYQTVLPGGYIALGDVEYTNTWTTVAMNDSGTNGDVAANDDVYSTEIPASVQVHRRLIRYRIVARDNAGAEVKTPYVDDPVPNFAYFCYDGVPGWRGALRPGSTPTTDFSASTMSRLPAIHLISQRSEVEDATWFSRYGGDAYPWIGTLVYDGEVYDHIHFRARGGVWRYAMGKNMWKFDMNNGHYFQMRDNYGRKYGTTWTKLNLGASIQQGDYLHRGEQGMFESVGFKLFNLAGLEAPNTTFVQFRVIDDVVEAPPSDQFEGDFWGVYLAIEQEDGRFLDEHGLPDGNLYKMESGTGELNNLGRTGPADKSDLNSFLNTYRTTAPAATESWWRTNLDLQRYASYQAIVQGIHHYDISDGKNYFYFRNPETRLWSVHSWDLDLTWANNMYRTEGGGKDDLYRPVLGENGHPQKPAMTVDFKNRVREIRDLLFNPDQAGAVIEEYAELLRGPRGQVSILDADRYMWDYNPKMASSTYSSSLSKAGQGRFYQWPNDPNVTKDFEGGVRRMKDYVVQRSSLLSTWATDPLIPPTPVISYSGTTNYPADAIKLSASSISGATPLSIRWRVGEIWSSNAPAFDPARPRAYEITPVWESPIRLAGATNEVAVPAGVLVAGHAYRARARVGDGTGRWSSWSAPVEFIASRAANSTILLDSLRITELMPEPPAGSDFEFVELHNAGAVELDVTGVRFTSGIDYTIPEGTTLSAGGFLLITKHADAAAFRQHYGLGSNVPMVGPYSGSLANNGEQLTLKTPGGEFDVFSFEFGSGRGWPLAAQAGHSLVPVAMQGQASGALDYPGNWRASTYIKGSPGREDPPVPPPSVVLNEILAHTDYDDPSKPEYDSNDWIELFNVSSEPVLMSGYFLTDDPASLRKFAIPQSAIVAGGFLTLDEVHDFHNPITSGFGLDKSGEQLLLSYLPGNQNDRVLDEVQFKGEENLISLGRYPDGAAWWFHSEMTRNLPNRGPVAGPVISEVMYRPNNETNVTISGEFIEVVNPGLSTVQLYNSAGSWRLTGGVDFVFPPQVSLGAGEVLLVVDFDPSVATNVSNFFSAYGISNSVVLYGPYNGKLGNRHDRIALEKPQEADAPTDPVSWVIVDEVFYGNQSPWPSEANGSGASLGRVALLAHGSDPKNWVDSQPSPGTVLVEVLDADGDGIPNDWEVQFRFDPANPDDAGEDTDTDGMTNLDEYRSGTDPRDAASQLSLTADSSSEDALVLKFTARVQRSYTVQFSATAAVGSWQKLKDVEAGPLERTVAIEDSSLGAFDVRFYRVVTPALTD